MVGRPPKWTDEQVAQIKEDICKDIRNGMPLTRICKKKSMPSYETVYKWFDEDSAFLERYARARKEQGDTIYYEIQEIEGKLARKEIDPNSARVLIDSKKWRAGKMKPKKYGDKLHVQDDVQISFNAAPVKKGKAK